MKNKAVVGPRGRITIPSKLRKRHRLEAGMKVVFIEDSGRLMLRLSDHAELESLRGSLARHPPEEELEAD